MNTKILLFFVVFASNIFHAAELSPSRPAVSSDCSYAIQLLTFSIHQKWQKRDFDSFKAHIIDLTSRVYKEDAPLLSLQYPCKDFPEDISKIIVERMKAMAKIRAINRRHSAPQTHTFTQQGVTFSIEQIRDKAKNGHDKFTATCLVSTIPSKLFVAKCIPQALREIKECIMSTSCQLEEHSVYYQQQILLATGLEEHNILDTVIEAVKSKQREFAGLIIKLSDLEVSLLLGPCKSSTRIAPPKVKA